MRYWDSSAILPLFVQEPTSLTVAEAYAVDPEVVTWWSTQVECASALARLERDGQLSGSDLRTTIARLAAFAGAWHEVQPVAPVRQTAIRLVRVHDLRAAAALQLAAAVTAAEGQPDSLDVVTLDDRLALAADREGFTVLQPRQAGG